MDIVNCFGAFAQSKSRTGVTTNVHIPTFLSSLLGRSAEKNEVAPGAKPRQKSVPLSPKTRAPRGTDLKASVDVTKVLTGCQRLLSL